MTNKNKRLRESLTYPKTKYNLKELARLRVANLHSAIAFLSEKLNTVKDKHLKSQYKNDILNAIKEIEYLEKKYNLKE